MSFPCSQNCVKLKELHFPVQNTAGCTCVYPHIRMYVHMYVRILIVQSCIASYILFSAVWLQILLFNSP